MLDHDESTYLIIGRDILNGNPKYVLIERENEFVENLIMKEYQLTKTFQNEKILLYTKTDAN